MGNTGLAHFKDCKNLTSLSLLHTQVGEAGLAYLKDCKILTQLWLTGTKVTDLSPLRGMPLKNLNCDFKFERDAEVLRSIKTLETINGKSRREFWEEVEEKQVAFEAWATQTARMHPEQQAKVVANKLQELNPGYDGKVTPKIENGVVKDLQFFTDNVTNIWPLRALPVDAAAALAVAVPGWEPGPSRLSRSGPA